MNLTRLPFSDFENKKKYEFTTFKEQSIDVTMLNEIDIHKKIPSGNHYKFGLFENNQYYWLFNSAAVAKSRIEMIEIFSALIAAYAKNPEIKPFVYKVKRDQR